MLTLEVLVFNQNTNVEYYMRGSVDFGIGDVSKEGSLEDYVPFN
jgi:hypothetical protein